MKITIALLSFGCLLSTPAFAGVIALGQFDDFENGTAMGWAEGPPSPNPPVNIPDGGPLGAGDAYLQNVSDGSSGPGGRLAMFNRVQWTGDYLAEGIDSIEANLANFGDTPLYMRIGVQGNPGERFASSNAIFLPADGAWHHVTFGLSASDLSLVSGIASLDDVLGEVQELRILSREANPGWQADAIATTLGADNITAVPEPASALALGLALVLLRRR